MNQTESSDRVALVTGAARRIGAAIVRELHAAGWQVVIHCRSSRDEADALASELNELRAGSAKVVTADLLNTDSLPGLVAATLGHFGRLDLLVNNASSFYPTPVGKITESDWQDLLGSNLKAPVFLVQAAREALRDASGSIVNIIDMNIDRPIADHPVYLAAKGGLATLTRALARDLAPAIRVNGVSPGAILWPESGLDAQAQQAIVDATPLARTGAPEDIARAVRFFAENAFVTGQVLAVDGGRGL
ncbi:MAG: pteridine reductase [Gammaproteobacteria bacterium]|nr:pteridine reductase [Gammaproteobacteria bacterium]